MNFQPKLKEVEMKNMVKNICAAMVINLCAAGHLLSLIHIWQQKPTAKQKEKQDKAQDKSLKADKPKKAKGMKM